MELLAIHKCSCTRAARDLINWISRLPIVNRAMLVIIGSWSIPCSAACILSSTHHGIYDGIREWHQIAGRTSRPSIRQSLVVIGPGVGAIVHRRRIQDSVRDLRAGSDYKKQYGEGAQDDV